LSLDKSDNPDPNTLKKHQEIKSMSEKQELIRKMLKMQKEFIAQEHEGGVDPKDYFAPEDDHPLAGFRESYADIATQVVDLAHEEKGSKR
tara:strand:- start:78 stop:347 length:270 start_codon:yes stop_codon:yes gene_type:complete